MTIDDVRMQLSEHKNEIIREIIRGNVNIITKFNSCKQETTKNDLIYILNKLGFSLNEMVNLRKNMFKVWPSYKLFKSSFIQTYLILIKISLLIDEELAKQFFLMLCIETHYSILKKFVKHCNEHYYQLAIEYIPRQHLFNQKGSLTGAFYYLADVLFNRWKDKVEKQDDYYPLYRLLYDFRTRWNQSMLAVARKYYDIAHNKIKIVDVKNKEFLIDDQISQAINTVINDIKIYKIIDNKIIQLVSSKVKMKPDYIRPIIEIINKELDNQEITDLLYMIVNNVNAATFLTTDFYKALIKRMSVRYTKNKNSLKEILDNMILKALEYDETKSIKYVKLSLPYKQRIRLAIIQYYYFIIAKALTGR